MISDPAARAAYVYAIRTLGLSVTVQRVIGSPPNAILSPIGGASITAIVRHVTPDTTEASAAGYPSSHIGAIGQADREVLMMTADLDAAGFPLPLQTGDQIVLAPDDGGETLTVVRPDAATRKTAGVVSCTAVGLR